MSRTWLRDLLVVLAVLASHAGCGGELLVPIGVSTPSRRGTDGTPARDSRDDDPSDDGSDDPPSAPPDDPPGDPPGEPPGDPPGDPPGEPPGEPPDDPPGDPPPGSGQCYSEPIAPDADVDDLVAAYGGSGWQDELFDIMDLRHPATGALLALQRNDSYFGQFSDSSSWPGMVEWLDTLSHEETHLFNAYEAMDRGVHHVLFLRADLVLELPAPDTDVARSRIYADLDPGARNGIYAPTYLTGDQGARGFVELLDETSCYLNEIGALGSVGEYYPGYGVSLRDGVVALLYFVEEYLALLESEEPAAWSTLHAEPAYRDAVRLLWQRTHFLRPFADAHPSLGVDDDLYRALLHTPARMDAVSRFIGWRVTDSPCVSAL